MKRTTISCLLSATTLISLNATGSPDKKRELVQFSLEKNARQKAQDKHEETFIASPEWKAVLAEYRCLPIQIYFIPVIYAQKAREVEEKYQQNAHVQLLLNLAEIKKPKATALSLREKDSQSLLNQTEATALLALPQKPVGLTDKVYEQLHCHETLNNSPETFIKSTEKDECDALRLYYCAKAVAEIEKAFSY